VDERARAIVDFAKIRLSTQVQVVGIDKLSSNSEWNTSCCPALPFEDGAGRRKAEKHHHILGFRDGHQPQYPPSCSRDQGSDRAIAIADW
jgi:hypothetical protein